MHARHRNTPSRIRTGAQGQDLRPNFVHRLWMVFIVPGELFRRLAVKPVWFSTAMFFAGVTALVVWLTPADAFGGLRESIPLSERAQMPPLSLEFFRLQVAVLGTVASVLFPVVMSLITFLIFVVIRRDRATFKQHLCVHSHAGIVLAFGGLATLPIRMYSLDYERSLSVGSFFPFLREGYTLHVMQGIELFSIWACIVAGLGLSLLDCRRTWWSTAGILLGLLVVSALVRAL